MLLLFFVTGASTLVLIERGAAPTDDAWRAAIEDAEVLRVTTSLEHDIAEAKKLVARAAAACSAAEQLALDMAVERSLAKLQECVSLYEAGALGIENPTAVAHAFVQLGAGLLVAGSEERAYAAFRRAISFQPDYAPNPRIFNPNAMRVFSRAKNAQTQVGALTVAGEPAGAKVILDGRLVGELPVSLPGLSSGTHWLTVTKEGYTRFFTQVEIPKGTTSRNDVFLKPLSVEAKAIDMLSGALADNEQQTLTALASKHHARFLVVVNASLDVIRVWDDERKRASERIALSRDRALGEARDFIRPRPASAPVVIVTPPLQAPPPREPPAPVDGRLSPFVAWLPLGIGQFAARRPLPGSLFLLGELALIAAAGVTAGVVLHDRNTDGTYNNAKRDGTLQIVNVSALAALIALGIGGAIEGELNR